MNSFLCIGVLCIVSGIVAGQELDMLNAHRYRRATCDSKYSEIDPNHSMCLTDVGQEIVLTEAEKQAIVDQHNLLREVQGNGQPAATNMQKIVWDEEIAMVASKWARQCGSGATAHEPSSNRRAVPSLPKVPIGQNAANGQPTFERAIQDWYDEVEDFTYGVGSTNGGVIGHYTQVVNSNVARIGCGKAMCNGRYNYVCDYARGQYSAEMKAPYKSGSPAAECPNTVDTSGRLCDCDGLICVNGGTIDVNTCTCTCPSLYKGNTCGELNCPATDKSYCGTGFPPDYCALYSNVPEECPYMCGICDNTPCSKTCQNGGSLDTSQCKCDCVNGYSGDECKTAPTQCTLDCGANGNLISTTTECRCSCINNYSGELCQTPPCTLNCGANGDLVSTATECRCSCRNGYTGNTCQTAPCTLNCGANGDLVSTATECRCQCRNGYTGNTCQTAPVSCTLQCGSNGDLVITSTGCRCQCKNNYQGVRCEIAPTMECRKECQNGGTLDRNTCTCSCLLGYTGSSCENGILPTCSLDCQNGGVVAQSPCRCVCSAERYVGPNCQFDRCSGRDHIVCNRLNIRPSYCTPIAKQFCPQKCGLCGNTDSQCQLRCYNGGALIPSYCSCRCPFRFFGKQCEYQRF